MEDQHAPVRPPTEQFEDIIQQRINDAVESLEVYGVAELADRWGVTKQRVDQIASKWMGNPWRRMKMGRVWTLAQVQAFEEQWARKTGIHVTIHPPGLKKSA